jgi:hypothetical protein
LTAERSGSREGHRKIQISRQHHWRLQIHQLPFKKEKEEERKKKKQRKKIARRHRWRLHMHQLPFQKEKEKKGKGKGKEKAKAKDLLHQLPNRKRKKKTASTIDVCTLTNRSHDKPICTTKLQIAMHTYTHSNIPLQISICFDIPMYVE